MTEPSAERDTLHPDDEAAGGGPAARTPSADGEGCRRAGCGFALGVLGSALITLAIVATVLTRGQPLALTSRLFNHPTPVDTPVIQREAALPTTVPTAAPKTATATRTPSPTNTFIPVPTAVPTHTPTPTPTATPTPIIEIKRVQSLGRYESMEFVIQTVVDLAREPHNFWERICGSDQLLLVAGGEVIAGFDLSKIKPGDLEVEGRRLKLTLPPAEVFSYFVKEDQTRVYLRNTGLLCRPDPNLETDARRQAEQRLLDYALEQGILPRAEKAGVTQLEAFMRGLGFEQVEIAVTQGD